MGDKKLSRAFVIIAAAMSIYLFIAFPISYRISERVVTITVTDKERDDGKEGSYWIHTRNEAFKNNDSILFWVFNSSELYEELEIGRQYEVRVAGWSLPALALYRNIIEIQANAEER